MEIETQSAQIPATDGYPLAATIFEPTQQDSATAVIINSATAVSQRYYRHFAHFLREGGYTVITYDYRGIGGSRPDTLKTLKGFPAKMRDWAEIDMASVLDWVDTQYQPQNLFFIGHSFGGQGAGLLANNHKIDAMVAISTQNGYWGNLPGSEKYRAWVLMHLLLLPVTRLFGYFPWRYFGSGEDMPYGVTMDWVKWCRLPHYFYDDDTMTTLDNFSQFTAPILSYSISDDVWGSERAVNSMMAGYTNAQVERKHLTLPEKGVESLGHFGFFRPKAKALWPDVADWLKRKESVLEQVAV